MASFSYSAPQPESIRTIESTAGDVTTTYVGNASPGTLESEAKWQIRKIVTNNVVKITAVTYAGGNALYKNVWNDREAYAYS